MSSDWITSSWFKAIDAGNKAVDLFAMAEKVTGQDIGYGLTKIEIPEYGKPILRVKAWRTVDEDGARRPQWYKSQWPKIHKMLQDEIDRRAETQGISRTPSVQTGLFSRLDYPTIEEELELFGGYWQPRLAGDA